jgi:hypothetical protein
MNMYRFNRRVLSAAVLIAMVAAAAPAPATVKLITLPARERVELQLDHPNVTLVEEERTVPLTAGVNDVVFAWSTASVDKDSIQLRCLSHLDQVKVLSVSYPPGENALTWQVSAPAALSVRVRIGYVVGGLDKSFTYRAVAGSDETTLALRQFIQLHNHANEDFGEAGMWAGFGERFERPIGIHETKQLLSAKFLEVPVRKAYAADLAEFGYLDPAKKQLVVPMHYLLKNSAAGGLGGFPLVGGKVRMFQDDGHGTQAFLGEDWGCFTPRDDEMKLFLGQAKDIVVKRTIDRRDAVRVLGNLHDYDVIVRYEIENFKDAEVVLDLAESLPALRAEVLRDTGRDVQWEFGGAGTLRDMRDAEKSMADKVVFRVPLPARGGDQRAVKQVHSLHVILKNEW